MARKPGHGVVMRVYTLYTEEAAVAQFDDYFMYVER